MAVTTKKLFNAVGQAGQSSTTVFASHGIELNNQDDIDVYVTKTTAGIAANNGKRILHYRQSTASNLDSNHPQVNNTDGLYFPAITASGGTESLEKLNNGRKDLKKPLLSFYIKKLKLVLIGRRYKFNLKLQKEQRLSI